MTNTPYWLGEYQQIVDTVIHDFFDVRYPKHSGSTEKNFEEALRYAVEGGGKRLRPILAMVAYEGVTGVDSIFWKSEAGQEILRGFIGIECIHCYTLVHDDLPSMDNDILRRGKPTVWKAYGEPMALLVGDALQTIGFELISTLGSAPAMHILTKALGDMGVVRGQVRDTFLRHDQLSLKELLRIHDEKTGGFIAACLVIGATIAGANDERIKELQSLGFLLGRAFQIRDDILDVEAPVEVLGKTPNKDTHTGKGIVSCIGIERSYILLQELEEKMYQIVPVGSEEKLSEIILFVISREK